MVDFLWTHRHCVRPGNGLGRRLSFPAEITSGKAVGWGRALNPCLLIQVTFMRSRAPFAGDMNATTGAGQLRSARRRVGNARVSTSRSRGVPIQEEKKTRK